MSAATPVFHSIIDQFMADMRANGIDIDEPIVADGKRHRYYVRGDKRNSRNAWAILHIDDHPAGVYGYWKMPGERFKWSMKGSVKLTPAERKQLKETARRRVMRKLRSNTRPPPNELSRLSMRAYLSRPTPISCRRACRRARS
jgi:phage/plasmid primase-like uncharacterized protein